jgi:hypothetical protein
MEHVVGSNNLLVGAPSVKFSDMEANSAQDLGIIPWSTPNFFGATIVYEGRAGLA